MDEKQPAPTRCYACFKDIVRASPCPDCLNEFCSQTCVNGHKKFCHERLRRLDPAPKFICPFCGTKERPKIVVGTSASGTVATGLIGLLFGWLIALGARQAMSGEQRECSRCGKSLEGVPEEGRPL